MAFRAKTISCKENASQKGDDIICDVNKVPYGPEDMDADRLNVKGADEVKFSEDGVTARSKDEDKSLLCRMDGKDMKCIETGQPPKIDTVKGKAELVNVEIEDRYGNWNQNYSTSRGYYVVHKGDKHFIYKVK